MDSNSITAASVANVSKDFGKKKRSYRSAKLKQCKLDARREQWLSHARSKGCKEKTNCMVAGALTEPVRDERNKNDQHLLKDLEIRRQRSAENCESVHPDSDSESPANSPSSSVSCGNEVRSGYSGTIVSSRSSQCSSSSSSFSSGGYGSESITEDEEGGDNGCFDDWEAIADALAAASVKDQPAQNQKTFTEKEVITDTSKGILGSGGEKPRSDILATESKPVANRRAWRPDDALRPHGLPNLSKQNSFPMDSEKRSVCVINPWGHRPVFPAPRSCPICCEDLDLTDSSFLPCPCGFRLCLFCHKRIMEEDARCPGCRKTYNVETVEKEASVGGGGLTMQLTRSCSFFTRT